MLSLLLLALSAALVVADDIVPSPPVDAETQLRLDEHQQHLRELSQFVGEPRVTFRSKWVNPKGIYETKPSEAAVLVEATDTTEEYTHYLGAKIVFGMVQFMETSIFNMIAKKDVSLGIFSYLDKGGVTVFPEFAGKKDRPECAGTCAGNCSNTCTGDGRKYESLAGLATTTVAAVLEDTILCNSRDPYKGRLNVAVHEFAHSVQMGLKKMQSPYQAPLLIGEQIDKAYNNAKEQKIWDLTSYAMTNTYEYFAEATGTYLNTDQYSSAGGMNKCDGSKPSSCKNEYESRSRLANLDPLVYNAITEVVVNQNPNLYSGLKTCMT